MKSRTEGMIENFFKLGSYPLTILSIYASTFFIYQDFGIRLLYGKIILSILFIPVFAKWYYEKWSCIEKVQFTKIQISYFILSLFVLINFLRPNSFWDKENAVYIVSMLLSLGYILFSLPTKKDIKMSMHVFIVFAAFYSILIIFFQMFKDLYWHIVFPYLSDTSQELAQKYTFKGYSIFFGGVSQTAYILIMGFLSSLFQKTSLELNEEKELVLNINLILIGLSLLLLGRRGELIALILSLIVYYVLSAPEEEKTKRLINVFLLITLSITAVLILLPYLSNIKFLHRYTMTLDAIINNREIAGGVTSGRNKLYAEAWSLFKNNKVLGLGWGSFINHGYVAVNRPWGEIRNVHNILLQLLAEVGIIGAVFYLSQMFFMFYLTLQNFYEAKEGTLSCVTKSISINFQLFIFIVSMVDPFNYKIIFWILYCIILQYGMNLERSLDS